MMLLALPLAYAAAQDLPLVPGGEDDGTRTIVAEPRCDSSGDEIVICRKDDQSQFRLKKTEPRYQGAPVRATRQLGPGVLSVEGEQRALPGGGGGPAAMVRFRIPLGRKDKK
ncbi:MAG: hypothetical protein MT490_13570 [Sphingomonas sp.]|uniref:hypothetical protein n=1 Tax=Sphingomonas sp. TaxID=28214 RepID=UPI002276BDD1|nr:hypothetical protein [Sphingomonas sp.]MCX8476817.1 hypothetical protein [Sphingomonas sp.]